MEHEVSKAVVGPGQMGMGMRGMCGEQAGPRAATCWTPEACWERLSLHRAVWCAAGEHACGEEPSPPEATRLRLACFLPQRRPHNLLNAVSAWRSEGARSHRL